MKKIIKISALVFVLSFLFLNANFVLSVNKKCIMECGDHNGCMSIVYTTDEEIAATKTTQNCKSVIDGECPANCGVTLPTAAKTTSKPVDIKPITLVNPIDGVVGNEKGTVDLAVIFGRIIASVMGIVGSIALLVFVAGGFMWLTSAGNQEQVKKGSQAMIWAAAGILVIFASYAILTMVLDVFGVKGGSI